MSDDNPTVSADAEPSFSYPGQVAGKNDRFLLDVMNDQHVEGVNGGLSPEPAIGMRPADPLNPSYTGLMPSTIPGAHEIDDPTRGEHVEEDKPE